MSKAIPHNDEETLRVSKGLKGSDYNYKKSPLPLQCTNPQCMVSTAPDGNLTFGSGELSEYGYWNYPCEACARAYEAKNPETSCYPPKFIPAIKHFDDPNNLKISGFDVPVEAFNKVHGPNRLPQLDRESRKINKWNYSDKTKKREGLFCAECKQFFKWGETSFFSQGGRGSRLNIDMCRTCIRKYTDCEYDIPEGYYRVY